jgi:hypothetical protein
VPAATPAVIEYVPGVGLVQVAVQVAVALAVFLAQVPHDALPAGVPVIEPVVAPEKVKVGDALFALALEIDTTLVTVIVLLAL